MFVGYSAKLCKYTAAGQCAELQPTAVIKLLDGTTAAAAARQPASAAVIDEL